MTKGPMEVAILGLLLETDPELRAEQLLDFDPTEGLATEADDLDLGGAIELMIDHADPMDLVDHVWMARSLVLARRHPDAGEVEDELRALAAVLMSPWGLPDPSTAAEDLVAAVDRMLVGQPLTTDAVNHLVSACSGSLVVAGSNADPQVVLSGTMGAFATMVIELATNDLSCRSSVHEVEVDGEMKEAVFVEVDVCTNKPFAEVSQAIDPRRWPDANPFFLSVTVQGTPSIAGKDWSGVVKEVVGPGVTVPST